MSISFPLKYLLMPFVVILTSFYFFPFEFSFLPAANTKMILAAFGPVLLALSYAKNRNTTMDRNFFVLSVMACIVSLCGFLAVTYNETPDYSYVTYIVSMWVWLSGAYVVVRIIEKVHGHISLPLLCNYLIAVCTAQCIVAFSMSLYTPLKNFVDGFLASSGFMGTVEDRIYGIGASLDVAGMRFAAMLVIIVWLCLYTKEKQSTAALLCYSIAFCVISTFGNMIGRSTVIGVAMALVLIVLRLFFPKTDETSSNTRRFFAIFVCFVAVAVAVLVFYYNVNTTIRTNLRFAFEGFFSIAEKGHWETNSNNILKNMVVFPDNVKTWIIGDGYMENPRSTDIYFTGKSFHGFYMSTDIGYLRFIFYFGVLGLLAFSAYMVEVARCCIKKFPHYTYLFLLLLLANFVFWFKVSSDLFLLFALFLVLPAEAETDKDEAPITTATA